MNSPASLIGGRGGKNASLHLKWSCCPLKMRKKKEAEEKWVLHPQPLPSAGRLERKHTATK